MLYNMKSLKRRRRTDMLSGDARPRTADPERSGHYYNDSKVLSMVDLTMIPSHSFQQTIERPRTASGIPLDREHNGLSLNPPTPFVYDRLSQSLRPAGCMPEAQPQDSQIGLALGSPRELLGYVAESATNDRHPPLNRWQTLGPDRGLTKDQGSQLSEEVDRPLKPKARRWKSVSGFLGRIRSSTITQPPVPSLPVPYDQPVTVPMTTSIVKTSLDNAKKSLHMKRKTKTEFSPNLARNETNKRQYPPLLIPQNTFLKSGPVSAMSPQIDVVIPTAELDRCSVMFEERLRLQQLQHQQRQLQPIQSLLERRQKAGVDLKLMNPEVKQDRSVQPQSTSEAVGLAAAEHRPARSSSLLHLQGKSIAAPSGFKYDRISTASQPLFIAQEADEYEYDDHDAYEDDKSYESSDSSTLMTDVDESPKEGKEEKVIHIPKAPSRAPPPPPPPPAFVFSAPKSEFNPTESLEQAAVRYSVTSFSSSRNSWSSAAVALVPSPTWSTGAYFPPSPTVSTSDFPSLPYLSPWDPSAPFSASPSLVTCSPGMTSEKRFSSPGLTPPPHSAMSNISKFGYDAPHSPLLAIAHTVSVIMTSKSGEDLRASAAQEAFERREKETEAGVAAAKQGARFLTRSRSERLVAGYSSGRAATPTFVSVSDISRAAGGDARNYHEGADADMIFVDGQRPNIVCDAVAATATAADCTLVAANEDKNEVEATFWAMAASQRSCRGSLIDM